MKVLIAVLLLTGINYLASAQFGIPPIPVEPPQEAIQFIHSQYPKATRLDWRALSKGFKASFNEPVGTDEPTLNADADCFFDESGKWRFTLWRNRYGKSCKDSLDPASLKQIEKHCKGKANYFDKEWLRQVECSQCYLDRKTKQPVTKTWAVFNLEGVTIFDRLGNFISFEEKQLEF